MTSAASSVTTTSNPAIIAAPSYLASFADTLPVLYYGVTYFKKRVGAPFDDGARSLAIIHPGIVRRSTGEPWRGPDGCGIRVHADHTAPDPVSKSEKARL